MGGCVGAPARRCQAIGGKDVRGRGVDLLPVRVRARPRRLAVHKQAGVSRAGGQLRQEDVGGAVGDGRRVARRARLIEREVPQQLRIVRQLVGVARKRTDAARPVRSERDARAAGTREAVGMSTVKSWKNAALLLPCRVSVGYAPAVLMAHTNARRTGGDPSPRAARGARRGDGSATAPPMSTLRRRYSGGRRSAISRGPRRRGHRRGAAGGRSAMVDAGRRSRRWSRRPRCGTVRAGRP